MNIPERISALRALMEERGYDVYMVPTDDFHQSEYVGDHFKVREYITGFTGSAGTAVFTKDEAGLWTDGRYFLQADQQLAGTGVKLYISQIDYTVKKDKKAQKITYHPDSDTYDLN